METIRRRPARGGRGAQCTAWRAALQAVAAGMLLTASAQPAAGDKIYLSYEGASKSTPSYTDRPLNETSRMIATVDPRTQRGMYTGLPARAAPFLRRKTQEAGRDGLDQLVQRTALTHGVDAALVKAVIEVESGFNAQARSAKGAAGLMQVMPATAARYGQFDLYAPEQNVDVGTRYLRDLLRLFKGNVRLALAAYNSGENAVIRHGRSVPPYPETLRYVPQVLGRYRYYVLKNQADTTRLPQAAQGAADTLMSDAASAPNPG